jgi:checkpoint serine/threonine-protein kinase
VRNGLAPKTLNATFTPFVDKTPAFTPFRDIQEATAAPSTDRTPSGPISRSALSAISISQAKEEEKLSQELPVGQEGATEEYGDEYQEPEGQFEVPADDGEYEEDDDQYYRDAPLGGRFGQFNVMTPITERTCEFTMGTTPKDPQYESPEEGSTGSLRGSNVFIPSQVGEHEALKNAERLAAELREEPDIEGEEEENEVIDEPEEEYVQVQMQQLESDHLMDGLEERAASLSLAEKQSPSQQFHFSNPCNPFEFTVLSLLLSQVPSDEHFYDLHDQTSKRVEALKKSTRKSAPLSPYTLALDGHRFMVSEKLGEGGFGSVFKARDMGKRTMAEEEDDFDDLDIDLDIDLEDDESSSSFVAIKVVKPRNIWEYHVLRRLHASLPSSLCRSLVLPHALYAYSDESFLVLSLCSQGMLLNIINNAVSAGVSQQGACLDELLVMFFSIELIRLVEGIHNAGFIHGDLKIDNCLLRLEDIPGGSSAWDAQYQPSGEDGWSYKGLKLIDFGRTIDTTMFPSGQEYLTDWATDERDCFELRQGRPWTFQTDYFGLAGIIYCMLFGKYLQESSIALISEPELELESKSESETKRYKIGTPLKRYWQGDIWNRLFDVLLNPCLVQPDGTLPICEELASIRKDMEVWLQVNCNRSSNTLKGLLKKVEKSCYTT